MIVDIERCIKEKIVIWCTTPEQAQQIANDYYKFFELKPISYLWNVGENNPEGFEVFVHSDMHPSWQSGYNKTYFISSKKATICLNYDEVLINKTYELW